MQGVLLLLLAFAALVAARLPNVFIKGRFWAEEGTTYFANALHRPWHDALFAEHSGYINLTASAATLLARHLMPLAEAPLLTSSLALLIQACPAILLATSGIAWLTRPPVLAIALLLVATPVQSAEVWVNAITSQFHLTLCTALILALPPRPGAVGVFRTGLLALAGLSGPTAAFLLPLLLLRAWKERTPARLREAAVLAIAACIQVVTVLLNPVPGRPIGIAPHTLLLVVLIKQILLPLTGSHVAREVAVDLALIFRAGGQPWLAYAAVLAIVSLLAALIARARVPEARWFAIAASLVAILSYSAALGGDAPLITVDSGLRYAFIPNVLMALAWLAIAVTGQGAPRWIAAALVIATLVVGIGEYWRIDPQFADGPAWRNEVARWRADASYWVQFWPAIALWKWPLGPAPGG